LNSPNSVWVLGGTGYAGLEAVRLLLGHPFFHLDRAFASQDSPERDLGEIDPSLRGSGLRAVPFSTRHLAQPPAAALLALPDEVSVGIAVELLERGVRVVDLSGAFRVRDTAHYPRWCGFEHPAPAWLDRAVYGLTEWEGERHREASLIANPGCYPTAALLGVLPLERAGLLDPAAPIVVDGKSGVSGAGRRLEPAYLFAEVNENFKPYRVLEHRHLPEMLQAIGLDPERPVLFVPHLLPLSRGLLSTLYLSLRQGVTAGDVAAALAGRYEKRPFVRLLGQGCWPELRAVTGTNRCEIGWTVDSTRRVAVVVSAIDNLLKGAAGQAVQNLNLMFGRPEAEGLPA
jgi:N-acetyl-gamma-glutamyl-phosphate reductase